ncbi:MAG TPA: GDP-L-fucose synthase [Thermoanaerobaculia bacterium]|nr:GDP-L-fucose synthase [Thermoanaerobaculia bacterium]
MNRVWLTGGGGFLGSHLREKLSPRVAALSAPRASEVDLRDPRAIEKHLDEFRPDLIVHAAAVVGGIGANLDHPGRFFYENALMGIQLIEAARRAGVGKFVCIGTVCAYPKFTPTPFREDDLWSGYPEETNAPYGLAKKMLLVQLQAYRQEYGFNGIYLLPANLYGPRDNFDLRTSHVIPAMIRKFMDAGLAVGGWRLAGERDSAAANAPTTGNRQPTTDNVVTLWGDGTPTREFLYVDDAVDGILTAAEKYDGADPVNLGTGTMVSIADLAQTIATLTDFRGRIEWDTSLPGGQPRRQIDASRAEERFGWRARVTLDEGLRRTIDWYRTQR